jgi:hypothetical protein
MLGREALLFWKVSNPAALCICTVLFANEESVDGVAIARITVQWLLDVNLSTEIAKLL